MKPETVVLARIADALERIAAALEKAPGSAIDGKVIAREVLRYTLKAAARGPSALSGNNLSKDRP